MRKPHVQQGDTGDLLHLSTSQVPVGNFLDGPDSITQSNEEGRGASTKTSSDF